MEKVLIILGVLAFIGFLYWAYFPDYEREPKTFWKIIFGMPIGMLVGGLGFKKCYEKIREWTLKK